MRSYEELRELALDLVGKAYSAGYEAGREAGKNAYYEEDDANIRAGIYKRILPSNGMKFDYITGEEVPE